MQSATNELAESGHQLCVWDVPLLYEAGMEGRVDEVWVIWVSREIQLERVKSRDKLSRDEILFRMRAQMSLDEKARRADVVIDNSGAWEATEGQLGKQWARLADRG